MYPWFWVKVISLLQVCFQHYLSQIFAESSASGSVKNQFTTLTIQLGKFLQILTEILTLFKESLLQILFSTSSQLFWIFLEIFKDKKHKNFSKAQTSLKLECFVSDTCPTYFSYFYKSTVFSQVSSVISLLHDTKPRVRVEKNKTVFNW